MNKLILISILSVAANLFHIATANAALSPTLAEVQDVSSTIKSIELLSGNEVRVSYTNTNSQNVITLTAAQETQLAQFTKTLDTAALVDVHHKFLCMMMPLDFARKDLYVDGRLVSSAQGCFLPDATYPQSAADQKTADQLRTALINIVLPKGA